MTVIRWFRVESPGFVAALSVRDGRVDRTAPILGYMKGRTLAGFRGEAEARGWQVEELESEVSQQDRLPTLGEVLGTDETPPDNPWEATA